MDGNGSDAGERKNGKLDLGIVFIDVEGESRDLKLWGKTEFRKEEP